MTCILKAQLYSRMDDFTPILQTVTMQPYIYLCGNRHGSHCQDFPYMLEVVSILTIVTHMHVFLILNIKIELQYTDFQMMSASLLKPGSTSLGVSLAEARFCLCSPFGDRRQKSLIFLKLLKSPWYFFQQAQ